MLSSERPKLSRTTARIKALCVVAFLVAAAAPLATAQNPLSNERSIHRSPDCLPRATRMRPSCDPKEVVVRVEKELEVSLELPPLKVVLRRPLK